jgi:hypothetical protein
MDDVDPAEALGALGGGLVVVGGFLPWITWVSGSVTGLERNSGLTILLGASAIGLALLLTLDERGGLVLGGAGLVTLGVGLRAYLDMQNAVSRIDKVPGLQDLAQVEAGLGLYLSVAGGALVTVAGILAVRAAIEGESRETETG